MLKKGDEACSCLPVDPIEAEATYKFAAYSIACADQSEFCPGLSTADNRWFDAHNGHPHQCSLTQRADTPCGFKRATITPVLFVTAAAETLCY
jgi:hypothetical protein